MEVDFGKYVDREDVRRMIAALDAFRGYEWWYRTENPTPEGRCLAPLVLQNMQIGYESGAIEPTMMQFKNLVTTAMFYERRCRVLAEELEALRRQDGDTSGHVPASAATAPVVRPPEDAAASDFEVTDD